MMDPVERINYHPVILGQTIRQIQTLYPRFPVCDVRQVYVTSYYDMAFEGLCILQNQKLCAFSIMQDDPYTDQCSFVLVARPQTELNQELRSAPGYWWCLRDEHGQRYKKEPERPFWFEAYLDISTDVKEACVLGWYALDL